MLSNGGDPDASAKVREELGKNPGLIRIVEIVRSAPERFEVATESAGLELVPLGPGTPSRCRMKLFRSRERKERFCAFFFKKSNLLWSGDRFSYGGVEFLPEEISIADIQTWLTWLTSGFDPEKRPERLHRAFLYDIPE